MTTLFEHWVVSVKTSQKISISQHWCTSDTFAQRSNSNQITKSKSKTKTLKIKQVFYRWFASRQWLFKNWKVAATKLTAMQELHQLNNLSFVSNESCPLWLKFFLPHLSILRFDVDCFEFWKLNWKLTVSVRTHSGLRLSGPVGSW